MFIFPLFYLAETFLMAPLLPGWIPKLLFLITLPLAGKFAFSWIITFLKTRGRWRWIRIKKQNPDLYREISREKAEILTAVTG